MKPIFSEPDVEELLSQAMVRISCAGGDSCSQD
jgi:hypothetical protein